MSKTKNTSKTVSKKAKVLSALTSSSQGLTRKSAYSRFKVVNLRATIASLRNDDKIKNIKTTYTASGEVKYVIG